MGLAHTGPGCGSSVCNNLGRDHKAVGRIVPHKSRHGPPHRMRQPQPTVMSPVTLSSPRPACRLLRRLKVLVALIVSGDQFVGILQSAGASAGMVMGSSPDGTSKNVATNIVTVLPELYAVCTWPCPGSTNAVPAG